MTDAIGVVQLLLDEIWPLSVCVVQANGADVDAEATALDLSPRVAHVGVPKSAQLLEDVPRQGMRGE